MIVEMCKLPDNINLKNNKEKFFMTIPDLSWRRAKGRFRVTRSPFSLTHKVKMGILLLHAGRGFQQAWASKYIIRHYPDGTAHTS